MNVCSESEIVVPKDVILAALSQEKVDEPPHKFYKYPARFAPKFARAVIGAFTKRGDTVLDPFCGGGTSVIEAILLGRKAVGFDLSSLAIFLTRAKTTPLSMHDKRELLAWVELVDQLERTTLGFTKSVTPEETYYQRNLPRHAKQFFENILWMTGFLPKERQERFARLVLLAVGQCAFDCKTVTPTWSKLKAQFCAQLRSILDEHCRFIGEVAKANKLPRCRVSGTRRIINRSSEESDEDGRVPRSWLPAKLVVTSPPYPGVHVVYHRWQIYGRKETPAPFWLANGRDGAGEAHYCMGHRREPKLETYFERLGSAFSSIRSLVTRRSLIVQLVAFSDPKWQLPAYLDQLEQAGFAELRPICSATDLLDGRIWRQVPGRKWYANTKGKIAASSEVLLFHRPT